MHTTPQTTTHEPDTFHRDYSDVKDIAIETAARTGRSVAVYDADGRWRVTTDLTLPSAPWFLVSRRGE